MRAITTDMEGAFLDFPNLAKRREDERYLLAATGDLAGSMTLDLLQLVPLTPREWQFASEQGSVALLEQLPWETAPKTYGWSAMGPS